MDSSITYTNKSISKRWERWFQASLSYNFLICLFLIHSPCFATTQSHEQIQHNIIYHFYKHHLSLSVCLSVFLSLCLSVSLSLCLSVSLSLRWFSVFFLNLLCKSISFLLFLSLYLFCTFIYRVFLFSLRLLLIFQCSLCIFPFSVL